MIAILLGVLWLVCLLVAMALCQAAGEADRVSEMQWRCRNLANNDPYASRSLHKVIENVTGEGGIGSGKRGGE
jgi:hypothetical protein